MSSRVLADGRLEDLAARVDRMATAPAEVKAPWTVFLARPLYKLFGWQPKLAVDACRALLGRLRDGQLEQSDAALEAALTELTTNVEAAERACMVNGRAGIAQLAWLGRLCRVLAQASRALAGQGEAPIALAAAFDPALVAPPLALAAEPSAAPPTPGPGEALGERLVELQLSAIDHIVEAARAETAFLERRRHLLEAARRLLLDADAALRLDPEGVRLRKRYLAEQIVQIDRVQGAGLSTRAALLHQARASAARGDRQRLYAALTAMEGFALAAGDLRGAALASRGLDELVSHEASVTPEARAESLARSAAEVFGEGVVGAVRDGYAGLRREVRRRRAQTEEDKQTYDLALEYLTPGAEERSLSALVSVDGCFDVGAPLAPVRVLDTHVEARVVEYPTEELLLTRARGPEDIPGAILEDPRAVLLDLAAGRLLTRKFVRYEERQRARTEMMGEVRVYLLDGSTSMMEDGEKGARARMRDAILSAELATLLRRFEHPDRFTRVVLYYRYFTRRLGPLHRVASAPEALAAIGEVLGTQRDGGTDIERALDACFEMIRDAQEKDALLARAQIVLITDGNAPVDEAKVVAARERVGKTPVGVSVVALGEENPALRQLVAHQRARGERAFYHFLDDITLAELCDGDLGAGRALHLPAELLSQTELASALDDVLEEAASLDRARHALLLHPPDDMGEALAELGLGPEHLSDGQRAQREAAERDRRAVDQRYARWFPTPAGKTHEGPEDADEDAVVLLLATVVEVIGELAGGELQRKADAIDVLERLLPDARLSPARYDAVVRSSTRDIARALAAVHGVTAPPKRTS